MDNCDITFLALVLGFRKKQNKQNKTKNKTRLEYDVISMNTNHDISDFNSPLLIMNLLFTS